MARYIQDPKTHKLIPAAEYDKVRAEAGYVGPSSFDPFVSPIDGTTIRTRRQYDDHCRKHNVVPAAEFSKEFYDRKRAERARVFNGERSSKEVLARKQELYEAITRAERQ